MKIIDNLEEKILNTEVLKEYEEECVWFEKEGSQETSLLIIWLEIKLFFLKSILFILNKIDIILYIISELLSVKIKDMYFAIERDTPANKLSSNKYNLRSLNEPNKFIQDNKVYCRRYKILFCIVVKMKSYSLNKRILFFDIKIEQ